MPKGLMFYVLFLLGLAMSWSAPASATCPVPNIFTNGQVADATHVMGNFNAIGNCAVSATGSPATGSLSVMSGPGSVTSGNLSGDVTTSGGTATSLSTTGVTPGSYTNPSFTVDAKGRITAASSGSAGNSGRLIGKQVITATGAGTYTPTSGTTFIIIELQGAGGGGGGCQIAGGSAVAIAGGGGGGAWLEKKITADFNGASYTIGVKGAGGAAGNNAGAAGGSTSFTTAAPSSLTYTAGGGGGGGQLGPTGAVLPAGETSGGSISGAAPDISMPGGTAQPGMATHTWRGLTSGGGPSRYSPGAPNDFHDGANMSVAGQNAGGKGGGGSGAMTGASGAAKAGGSGSDGMIIIWEFS